MNTYTKMYAVFLAFLLCFQIQIEANPPAQQPASRGWLPWFGLTCTGIGAAFLGYKYFSRKKQAPVQPRVSGQGQRRSVPHASSQAPAEETPDQRAELQRVRQEKWQDTKNQFLVNAVLNGDEQQARRLLRQGAKADQMVQPGLYQSNYPIKENLVRWSREHLKQDPVSYLFLEKPTTLAGVATLVDMQSLAHTLNHHPTNQRGQQ
jgi:hypothetical protein